MFLYIKIDYTITIWYRIYFIVKSQKIKRNIYSTNEDHIALRDLDSNHKGIKMYKKITEKLEKVDPKYRKVFDDVEKMNQIKYGGFK